MPNPSQFKTHEDYLIYYREYRNKNREKTRETNKKYRKKIGGNQWSNQHPIAQHAHGLVSAAIKKGLLKRKPCEKCGAKIYIRAHHQDYFKPLDVIWLCEKHHRQIHKELFEIPARSAIAVKPLQTN